jgi:hypothetical protein
MIVCADAISTEAVSQAKPTISTDNTRVMPLIMHSFVAEIEMTNLQQSVAASQPN